MCKVEGLCPDSSGSGRGAEHCPSVRAAACWALASAGEPCCLRKDAWHGLFLKENECRCYLSVFGQVRFPKDSPVCQMCTLDMGISLCLHQRSSLLVSASQRCSCLLRRDWTCRSKAACRFLPESLGNASVWTQAKTHSCRSCRSPKLKTQISFSLGKGPESHCIPECRLAWLH